MTATIDNELAALLAVHNGERDGREDVEGKISSDSKEKDSSEDSNESVYKFSIFYKNRTEDLRKTFCGDDTVKMLLQAIQDEIVGGESPENEKSSYGSKRTLEVVWLKKVLNKPDEQLKNLPKHKAGPRPPLFVTYEVIGGAHSGSNEDSKEKEKGKEKERVRMADFKNEKRIKPTLEPDCIYGFNEKKLRVKMPCGHVFDSNTIFKCVKMYVENLSKSKILCPVLKCKQEWPFDVVIAAADLTKTEQQVVERAMSRYTKSNEASKEESIVTSVIRGGALEHDNASSEIDFSQFCKTKKGGLIGLSNLGMTCFMNSSIQCLLQAPSFSKESLGFLEKQRQDHEDMENAKIAKMKKEAKMRQEKERKALETRRKEWEKSVEMGDGVILGFSNPNGWFDGRVTRIDEDEDNGRIASVECDHDGQIYTINVSSQCIQPACIRNLQMEASPSQVDSKVDSSSKYSRIVSALQSPLQYVSSKLWGGDNDEIEISYEREEFTMKRDSILDEWLYLIDFIHNGNKQSNNNYNGGGYTGCNYGRNNYNYNNRYGNCLSPKKFRQFLAREDSKYGDGRQHDACCALLVALSGMEKNMNEKIGINDNVESKIETRQFKTCVFDQNNNMENNNETNLHISQNNIVSKHFASVESTQYVCSNCGFGHCQYESKFSLQVPVDDKCIKLSLVKLNETRNSYQFAFSNVVLGLKSKAMLAKFYGLYYNNQLKKIDFGNKVGSCLELSNWDVILVNKYGSKKFKNGKFGRILKDSEQLNKISDNDFSLLMVRNEMAFAGRNEIISIFDQAYFKVLCFVIMPSTMSTCSMFSMVLKIGEKMKGVGIDKKTLKEELLKTKEFSSMCNLVTKKSGHCPYSVVFDVNGKILENCDCQKNNNNVNNDCQHFGVLTGNDDQIICRFVETSQLKAEKQENLQLREEMRKEKSLCDEIMNDIESRMLLLNAYGNNNLNNAKSIIKCLENAIDAISKSLKKDENGSKKNSNKEKHNNKLFNRLWHWISTYNNDNSVNVNEKYQRKRLDMCQKLLKWYENVVMQENNHELHIGMAFSAYEKGLKNTSFINETERKFYQINECIDEFEETRYVSSLTYEMECKCNSLININENESNIFNTFDNSFKFAPIVGITRKLIAIPQILIIKLDRGDLHRKSSHIVQFRDKLSLNNNNYDLFGVGYHHGTSNGGHYYARVKQFGTNDWYCCNDESITYCGKNGVNPDNAMFMCYQKIDHNHK